MIEIFLALAGTVTGVALFAGGRASAPDVKTVTVEADPTGFKCPYCTTQVYGYAELDRINHTACVGMAEADLLKIQEEAAKVKDSDKYKVTIKQMTQKVRPSNSNLWDLDYDTNTWVRYKWQVTKGGQIIDQGTETYKDDAEETAEAAIELHKDHHTEYEVA